MEVFVDARVAGEQGGAVQRQAVLPAVTIADERGRRARRRGVSGWKRFPAAIRAFAPGGVVEIVFQNLGCGERGGEVVGVLFGALIVALVQGDAGGDQRVEYLEAIAGRPIRIVAGFVDEFSGMRRIKTRKSVG